MFELIKKPFSFFNFNKNGNKMINLQNELSYSFEEKHSLSSDQVNISKEILKMFKDAKTPRLIQLISQPQAGKTNTILNICGLIDNFSKNNNIKREKAVILYFQPSDNALKKQLQDRFTSAEYWDKNLPYSDDISCQLIDDDRFEIYTPANIKGQANDLIHKLEIKRKHKRNIVFIHDESHRDIDGEDKDKNKASAKLPDFYKKNQIFLIPINRQEYDEKNNNKMNEIYINISASPSSFIEYMKEDKLGSYTSYYLKNHDNYLSFNDIHAQGRFKKGFSLTESTVDQFIIKIICENFLLQKPGCFVTRIGKKGKNDIKKMIETKINEYIKNPQLLQTHLNKYLHHDNCSMENISTILNNIKKLRMILFSSNGEKCIKDEIDEIKNTEFKLVNDWQYNNLKIEDMEYFLSDKNQNEDFKLLFIMESFLQGKTLELNNVRGWFDRYHENPYHNNAFTIQSVGRNCGPYKNKKYTYPIWVNLEEIRHIINFYNEIESSIDEKGLIDNDMWKNEENKGKLSITNTYVKDVSKRKLNEQFLSQCSKDFNSYVYEAEIFNSKELAINWLKEKYASVNLDLENLCVTALNAISEKSNGNNKKYSSYDINDFSSFSTSVSVHKTKNAINDILLKNYGRYSKTSSSTGFIFGIIHIDNPSLNPEYISSWNDFVLNNNSDSILTGLQNHYVVYTTRIDQAPLNKINRVKDNKSAIAISQKQGS